MKISDVKAISLRSPRDPFQCGAMIKPISYRITLVLIETDENITGVGGTSLWGYGERGVASLIEEALKPVLVGEDPNRVERLWTEMWQRHSRSLCLPTMYGISAVDIALWDIKGKVHGQPVSMLLGGCSERIKAYASTSLWMTPEQHVKAAEVLSRMGFGAMKIKVGRPDFQEDLQVVKAIMEAMDGSDFQLAVDGNQSFSGALRGYSPDDVLGKAKEFEKHGCIWFEEPVPSTDIDGLADLTRALGMPIALGENEYAIQQFKTLLEKGAADIIQPAIERAGGITTGKKLGVLAEVHNKPLIPHSAGVVIFSAAALQCVSSMSNCPMVEYSIDVDEEGRIMGGAEIHSSYLKDGASEWMIDKDGCIEVPKKPGIGIEVDVDKILSNLREE